jgi:hypothetical protein
MALERAGRKQRDLEKDLGEDLKAVEFRLFELSKCEARPSRRRNTIGPSGRFAERNSGGHDRD